VEIAGQDSTLKPPYSSACISPEAAICLHEEALEKEKQGVVAHVY